MSRKLALGETSAAYCVSLSAGELMSMYSAVAPRLMSTQYSANVGDVGLGDERLENRRV